MKGFDAIFKNVNKVSEVLKKATMDVAGSIAIEMERYAKENRPWTDRNAHARDHLRGKMFEKDGVVHCQIRQDLYGETGEEYGYYLEEAHGHKYAILSPTQQHFEEDFFEDVKEACMEALKANVSDDSR